MSTAIPEHELDKQNIIVASTFGARLFRNNVAQGWVGQSVMCHRQEFINVNKGDVVIRQARPLHAGLGVGSSDLIGWTRDGRFLAVEDKSPSSRIRPEQARFLEAVAAAGGVAVLARSTQDLMDALARGR